MRKAKFWAVTVLVSALVAGCGGAQTGGGQSGSGGSGSEGEVKVAATISVIGDMVERVGGDRVEVSTIVPVGGSPETFQPKPSDAGRISDAKVVFENGLGLETWLEDLLASAGGEDQRVVELSRGLEPIEGDEHGQKEESAHEEEGAHEEEEHGHEGEEPGHEEESVHEEDEHGHEHAEGNPHFWLDVENAEHYVEGIRDALIEADPDGEEEYRDNAREYLSELEELDAYIAERAKSIPEERRKLVTFHDAFPYFAEAYGFEMVGVVLRNPDAEPSSREVAGVVREIEEENVPAIFTEPQFNAGLADTIAREADVEVYELYSDTLTEEEAGGTYVDMMRTNIDRITEALG